MRHELGEPLPVAANSLCCIAVMSLAGSRPQRAALAFCLRDRVDRSHACKHSVPSMLPAEPQTKMRKVVYQKHSICGHFRKLFSPRCR